MAKFKASSIVRSVLKKHKMGDIWTNKYREGTRSVKCYARGTFEENITVITEVKRELARQGETLVDLRFTTGCHNAYSPTGIPAIIFEVKV